MIKLILFVLTLLAAFSSYAATTVTGFNTGSVVLTTQTTGRVTVGAGTAGVSGVIATLPTTTNGWLCTVTDITNPATHLIIPTGVTGSSVTVTDYSILFVAQNMVLSDVLVFNCVPY